MSRAVLFFVALALCSSCTSDGRPSNAIETKLSVTMRFGDFDPDYGMIVFETVWVNIDGKAYQLEAEPDAIYRGFDGLSRTALAGRRAMVAGEVIDGVYRATYAELLPVVEPKVDPAVMEMLAQREALEAEQFELHRKHSRLMVEGIRIGFEGEEAEKVEEKNQAELTSLEEKIEALQTQIDHIDAQILEESQQLK